MSIASIGASSLSALFALGRSTEIGEQQAFQPPVGAPIEAASPAASGTILPAANTSLSLSLETILQLQGQADEDAKATALEDSASLKPPTAEELFLEEARKSPIERMREQILEALGLTEESLAALPPDEKRAMEDKIAKMIEEKLRESAGGEPGAETSNASMIALVA
ncbi:hypothetical protein [Vitreimonas flagellata]|uniref:hypothetical protein n=1 Tax=Vitreimonas flagellata TaxID=2560861 RepID=UPI001074EE59|nr:hypothetical protein [Vitreimonas flagellata]